MLVHAKQYIDVDDACVQPNAVDLRVAALWRIDSSTTPVIELSDSTKEFFDRQPVTIQEDGYYHLDGGHQYDFITHASISVPSGYAGWLISRSTLNRNGIYITSGLYDSGYNGKVGGIMHVTIFGGTVKLKPETRIAQFIMAKAETVSLYDGFYNKNEVV